MSHISVAARRTYLAEESVAAMADTGTPVTVVGSTWDIEPMPTMSLVETVTHLCDQTCTALGVPPVTVRVSRSRQRYYYRDDDQTVNLIAIRPWITRAILHEVAHHLVHHRGIDDADHGPGFRQALVDTVIASGRPTYARLLAIQFDLHGLGHPTIP